MVGKGVSQVKRRVPRKRRSRSFRDSRAVSDAAGLWSVIAVMQGLLKTGRAHPCTVSGWSGNVLITHGPFALPPHVFFLRGHGAIPGSTIALVLCLEPRRCRPHSGV
jgi:hypothetical protein